MGYIVIEERVRTQNPESAYHTVQPAQNVNSYKYVVS